MAGGDHDAALKALGPDHVGDGGGGGDVEQIRVRPGGHQSAHQAVLKHIAAAAGVLADDDAGGAVAAAAAAELGVVPA